MAETAETMGTSIVFEGEAEATTRAVMAALARRHLLAVRSFDLRSALAHQGDCECPHHGTAECTCQYVVLLVYGGAASPVVLTCHCHDRRTQIHVVQDANVTPDPALADQVAVALLEAALTLRALPEALMEPKPDGGE
jgi:hypothetical protein